jgi:hypothetical protein
LLATTRKPLVNDTMNASNPITLDTLNAVEFPEFKGSQASTLTLVCDTLSGNLGYTKATALFIARQVASKLSEVQQLANIKAKVGRETKGTKTKDPTAQVGFSGKYKADGHILLNIHTACERIEILHKDYLVANENGLRFNATLAAYCENVEERLLSGDASL